MSKQQGTLPGSVESLLFRNRFFVIFLPMTCHPPIRPAATVLFGHDWHSVQIRETRVGIPQPRWGRGMPHISRHRLASAVWPDFRVPTIRSCPNRPSPENV